MLINTIDNALNYSPASGTIETSTEKARKTFTIEICNASAQLSPEELAKLFDQFYRVDTSHSSQTPDLFLPALVYQNDLRQNGPT